MGCHEEGEIMNSRLQLILKQLMEARIPITSEQIAIKLQVTSRTVRNDIKQLDHLLKDNGAFIEPLKGRGYQLEIMCESDFKQLLKQNVDQQQFHIPVEPEDRINYLVKTLLLQENYVKLDDLADKLFISRSTIQNDIRDVRVILKNYHLILEKKPNFGLKLKGDEKNIRFCMAEFLFDRNKIAEEMTAQSMAAIDYGEIELIRRRVMDNVRRYHLVLSDVALQNLVIHIAIACKRILEENYVSMVQKDFYTIKHQKEFKIARKIIKDIEKELETDFPEDEVAYIAMHLLGTKMLIHPSLKNEDMTLFLDGRILSTVQKMVTAANSELKLGIEGDKELEAALVLHLKPAMNRFTYRMNLRNPMLEAIKTNYPFAFEAAVLAVKVLEKEMNVNIDENETGYIALHFGAAIERGSLPERPKRCLLVCATGAGSAQLLYYKLRSRFGNELIIVGTTEYYNLRQHSLQDIDLIISTIPIRDDFGVPSLVVSTILGSNDLENIKQAMIGDKSVIRKYLRKQYIFLHKSFQSKHEVIGFLGNRLIEDRVVNEDYIQSVMDRERASPTSFGNFVAIPHPLEPQVQETFWMICTLKKPVDWGGKEVQFICLLNVSKENKEELKPMYKKLVNIMDDEDVVMELIQCDTVDKLISILESVR